MNDISFKAILVALAFNILGGLVATFIFTITWIAVVQSGSLENFEQEFSNSASVRIGMLIIGLVFAFASGWVCAHLAKTNRFKSYLILGILLTIISIIFIFTNPKAAPLWSQVISLMAFMPLVILGGYLYDRGSQNKIPN